MGERRWRWRGKGAGGAGGAVERRGSKGWAAVNARRRISGKLHPFWGRRGVFCRTGRRGGRRGGTGAQGVALRSRAGGSVAHFGWAGRSARGSALNATSADPPGWAVRSARGSTLNASRDDRRSAARGAPAGYGSERQPGYGSERQRAGSLRIGGRPLGGSGRGAPRRGPRSDLFAGWPRSVSSGLPGLGRVQRLDVGAEVGTPLGGEVDGHRGAPGRVGGARGGPGAGRRFSFPAGWGGAANPRRSIAR